MGVVAKLLHVNELQAWLLVLFALAAVLFVIFPRKPKIAGTYLRYLILILTAFVMLTPFLWLLAAAFKDSDVLMKHLFFPPVKSMIAEPVNHSADTPAIPGLNADVMNLENFNKLLQPKETLHGKVYFWQYLVNSLFLAGLQTMLQLIFSSMGGYALAKYDFPGKKIVMYFMLASMMIPGIILLAPIYDLMFKLDWIDTYKALVVPYAVSVFGMFLFRQAILGVPNDIIEAGRVDGCGEFNIYLRLVMPLVRPMSAAFCLISFMGAWNAFIGPNIFIHTEEKLTLTVALNLYLSEYAQNYGVFLSGTLIAIIPPAILFLALQREFISGLTSGAVKG